MDKKVAALRTNPYNRFIYGHHPVELSKKLLNNIFGRIHGQVV
jgi:hypothetical protein